MCSVEYKQTRQNTLHALFLFLVCTWIRWTSVLLLLLLFFNRLLFWGRLPLFWCFLGKINQLTPSVALMSLMCETTMRVRGQPIWGCGLYGNNTPRWWCFVFTKREDEMILEMWLPLSASPPRSPRSLNWTRLPPWDTWKHIEKQTSEH